MVSEILTEINLLIYEIPRNSALESLGWVKQSDAKASGDQGATGSAERGAHLHVARPSPWTMCSSLNVMPFGDSDPYTCQSLS